MGVLLLLFAFGAGAHVANRRSKAQNGPAPNRIVIDEGMPFSLKEEVIRALLTEQNAAKLTQFADSIGAQYPNAAFELRAKAWVAGGRRGNFPTRPAAMQQQVT